MIIGECSECNRVASWAVIATGWTGRADLCDKCKREIVRRRLDQVHAIALVRGETAIEAFIKEKS